ncbi:MAG: hypothetical protein C4530_17210 [Desulfobacteraceae bacterium]|nr:MAG: hypothetical protein C4530_17210 [Desulfobacteraceae bacterium]
MAKLVLISHRDGRIRENFREEAEHLSQRLTPDNIPHAAPAMIVSGGIHIAVFGETAAISLKETGVAMGHLHHPDKSWFRPGEETPEGSFALFKADRRFIELATDIVGSRTIWYAQTPEVFIAATSQRALVYFLQSFEPNEEAFAWMLSGGTLGPGLSWDRRVRFLPPNSRLLLDRFSWSLSLNILPAVFEPEPLSKREHHRVLEKQIEDVLQEVSFDPEKWVLPLSGGYDSRLLLLLLKDRFPAIKCVTWGRDGALSQKWNDAQIAQDLCRMLNVRHDYFVTEISVESIEKVFGRFLTAGEGRIDHLEPYLDGFFVWKHLSEKGVKGIIRGDECFGSRCLYSELDFRKFVFATMISDYAELREMDLPASFGQTWPERLRARKDETLETWRDRLYCEYYFAHGLSALNDLKLSYVEIMNPLIFRRIVERVRKLPDRLRTEKILLRKIVERRTPNVPFAKYPAIDLRRDYLKGKEVREFLNDQLFSAPCRTVLPHSLISKIMENLNNNHSGGVTQRFPIIRTLRPFFPPPVIKMIKKTLSLEERIDYFDLALRSCIVGSMTALLSRDARELAEIYKPKRTIHAPSENHCPVEPAP